MEAFGNKLGDQSNQLGKLNLSNCDHNPNNFEILHKALKKWRYSEAML